MKGSMLPPISLLLGSSSSDAIAASLNSFLFRIHYTSLATVKEEQGFIVSKSYSLDFGAEMCVTV